MSLQQLFHAEKRHTKFPRLPALLEHNDLATQSCRERVYPICSPVVGWRMRWVGACAVKQSKHTVDDNDLLAGHGCPCMLSRSSRS